MCISVLVLRNNKFLFQHKAIDIQKHVGKLKRQKKIQIMFGP
jgi:hypothetical protein